MNLKTANRIFFILAWLCLTVKMEGQQVELTSIVKEIFPENIKNIGNIYVERNETPSIFYIDTNNLAKNFHLKFIKPGESVESLCKKEAKVQILRVDIINICQNEIKVHVEVLSTSKEKFQKNKIPLYARNEEFTFPLTVKNCTIKIPEFKK